MKALLLAAGLGTRLRPLTLRTPKCLVKINGRPLLDYWLENLFSGGVTEVMINLHYLSDQVEKYLEKSPFGQQVKAVFEPELLGTAGTLFENRAFFMDDSILLVHADNFSVFELSHFVATHKGRPEHCEITMMTFRTDAPETCGILELDNEDVVIGFHEKVAEPPGNLANGAVYILEPSVLKFIEAQGGLISDFSTQVLPHYLNRIYTFHNSNYHRDIGNMESLRKAQERL